MEAPTDPAPSVRTLGPQLPKVFCWTGVAIALVGAFTFVYAFLTSFSFESTSEAMFTDDIVASLWRPAVLALCVGIVLAILNSPLVRRRVRLHKAMAVTYTIAIVGVFTLLMAGVAQSYRVAHPLARLQHAAQQASFRDAGYTQLYSSSRQISTIDAVPTVTQIWGTNEGAAAVCVTAETVMTANHLEISADSSSPTVQFPDCSGSGTVDGYPLDIHVLNPATSADYLALDGLSDLDVSKYAELVIVRVSSN